VNAQNGQPTEAAREATRKRRRREREAARQTHYVRYGPFGREIVMYARGTGYDSAETVVHAGGPRAQRGRSEAGHGYNIADIRAEAQRLDRNNALLQATNTRLCDVILGDGMTLQSKAAEKTARETVETKWRRWWKLGRPEVRGLDDGASLERKILRHDANDGDLLILRISERLQIQLITGDQIDAGGKVRNAQTKQRIEEGVELDEYDAPAAFWVAPYSASGMLASTKARRIPAEECIYLANRRRIDQVRGEPVHQCNFPMFHRISDVCDSEAAAFQLLSRVVLAITAKDAALAALNQSELDTALSGDEQARALAERIQDVGPALMVHLEPGEDVKGIERNIPGANFEASLKMFLRLLGLPLGFSLEFMLLIWSDTNYSSGRASIKQVERNTRPFRHQLEYAMSRIFRWWAQQMVARKELPDEADIAEHCWHFPPYPFIDPQKERQAQREAVTSGLSTMTREAFATGTEYKELLDEQAADIEAAIVRAEILKAKYPEAGISWRDFRPISEGGQSALVQSAVIPQTSAAAAAGP
jgi:lambda family phage portal protein